MMATSDFWPEVEISPFRALAMKNMKFGRYLWPNRQNSWILVEIWVGEDDDVRFLTGSRKRPFRTCAIKTCNLALTCGWIVYELGYGYVPPTVYLVYISNCILTDKLSCVVHSCVLPTCLIMNYIVVRDCAICTSIIDTLHYAIKWHDAGVWNTSTGSTNQLVAILTVTSVTAGTVSASFSYFSRSTWSKSTFTLVHICIITSKHMLAMYPDFCIISDNFHCHDHRVVHKVEPYTRT